MLDQAFEALKTYDWGVDRKVLDPIDEAAVSTRNDPAARKDLESRLLAVLQSSAPRDAKDYVCRELRTMGTAASVPALEALLADAELSHMARYALERIQAREAVAVMREQMPKLKGSMKLGVIGSLGVRRDAGSVPALTTALGDADKAVVRAALGALGKIGNPEAAKSLGDFAKKAPDDVKPDVANAMLICAEHLLADGKKAEALLLYKSLSGADQPKNIRLAAQQGLLSVATKKD